MSFIDCFKKMFIDFGCTKETKAFTPIHVESVKLDEVPTEKPLTIEEADTDNSEEEQELHEASEALKSLEDELEFNCDEKELVRILEEKEKEAAETDAEHNRFSMC